MSDRETRQFEARQDAASDRWEREHVGPESYRTMPVSATQITINRLQQETRKMRAQLARVRAMHQVDSKGMCVGCDEVAPCPTIRAIRGPDAGQDI